MEEQRDMGLFALPEEAPTWPEADRRERASAACLELIAGAAH